MLNISSNVKDLTKSLNRTERKRLPFALFKGMEAAAKGGIATARYTMRRDLHKPTKSAQNAIRSVFTSKRSVMRRHEGRATVFIREWAVPKLHPLVYGDRSIDKTSGGRDVITPVNLKLSDKGNIIGLRSGRLTRMKMESIEYLNVPLGSKTPRTRHLPPGLYEKWGEGRFGGLNMLLAYHENREQEALWCAYLQETPRAMAGNAIRAMRQELFRR